MLKYIFFTPLSDWLSFSVSKKDVMMDKRIFWRNIRIKPYKKSVKETLTC